MSRKLYFFLVLLFIPFMINAKEYCSIISGDINTVGSEIVCGEEHFYIVESSENTVKMLTKYNLDIGYIYDRVIISETEYNELINTCDDEGVGSFGDCQAFKEKEWHKDNMYYYHDYSTVNDSGVTEYSIIFANFILNEELKQHPEALAAHGGPTGKPEFPERGVIQIHPQKMNYDDIEEYFDGKLVDFSMEGVTLLGLYDPDEDNPTTISKYKDYLNEKGYSVNSINLLSVRDLNNIVLKATNKELPIEEWLNKEWDEVQVEHTGYGYWILGNIKEALPESYDWLFNTTFWTRTFGINSYGNVQGENLYFVDTNGNLCMQNSCRIALGAGVRPVIEMDKSNIIYNITPETDGNGTLDVPKTAEAGEIITYKAEAKDGYELDEIMIITDSGREIEITEDDVTCDENKVCTIKSDKFVMPEEDIIIRVKFVNILFNPKTGMIGVNGILFVLLCVFISGIVVFKSYNKGIGL